MLFGQQCLLPLCAFRCSCDYFCSEHNPGESVTPFEPTRLSFCTTINYGIHRLTGATDRRTKPIEELKILRRCVRDFARTRFKGKQTEFNLLQRRDTRADLGTVRRLRWPVVVLLIMCSPTSMACSGLSTCVPSFRSHMHLVSGIRIL